MRPEEQVRRDELWRPVLAQVLDDYRAVTGDVSSARPRQGADPAASPWAMSGYVDGPALPEIVGVLGPLPPSAVAALAIGIAGALAELHAVGVVRGDLNPVNVLLIEDGLGLRVAGFGMASAADGSTLAEAGWAFDDPGYLAPEQVLGLPVGPVVVPSIEPLEVEPVAAGPPEVELPPAEFCASANVLVRTNAVASAIVLYFMAVSSRFMDRSNRPQLRYVPSSP